MIKARKRTMTPDDKELLLQSPEKVIGAALSLHVIHDVSLSDLEARLAACGVEETVRKRALEAIRAKTSHAFIRPDTPGELNVSLATSSARIAAPATATVAAAKPNGLDAALSAKPDCDGQPARSPPANQQYLKMLAVGVPVAAVRARMLRDGKTEAEADAVAKVEGVAAPAVVPKRQSTVKIVENTPQRRVKALYWQKLEESVDVSATVWASPASSPATEVQQLTSSSGLVEDNDLALLEELFATKPVSTKKSASVEETSLKKISLIEDCRRASNVAIGLRYFCRNSSGKDDASICRAAASLSERLDGPKLRSLRALLPSAEEVAAILKFRGDKTRLARPERFFLATLAFEGLAGAVDVGIFRAEYEDTLRKASEAACAASRACEAVRQSSKLALILRSLLKLGNKLNAGHSIMSKATGVSITSIDRLCTAKANDGSTLLDYLIQVLAKKEQIAILDFIDSLPNLVEAARCADNEATVAVRARVVRQLEQTERMVTSAQRRFQTNDKAAAAEEKMYMTAADDRSGYFTQIPPAASAHAAEHRATLYRFVLHGGNCCRAARSMLEEFEAHLATLDRSKRELCAYFGEAPERSGVKEVLAAIEMFVTRIRQARDKHKRQEESKLRQFGNLKRSKTDVDFLQTNQRGAGSSVPEVQDVSSPQLVDAELQPHGPKAGVSSEFNLRLSKCRTAYNQKESKKRDYRRWILAQPAHQDLRASPPRPACVDQDDGNYEQPHEPHSSTPLPGTVMRVAARTKLTGPRNKENENSDRPPVEPSLSSSSRETPSYTSQWSYGFF